MMGTKQKLKTGEEIDVILNRGVYCYIVNSNVAHKVKKALAKRRRQETKKELRNIKQTFAD